MPGPFFGSPTASYLVQFAPRSPLISSATAALAGIVLFSDECLNVSV